MSDDPDSRLRDFLENCKIPLSVNDWQVFYKELEQQKLNYFYHSWIGRRRKWFKWLSNPGLDEKNAKDSLILALDQNGTLRTNLDARNELWGKASKGGSIEAAFRDDMEDWKKQESGKKRDRKPSAPGVVKNWLEPMPIFNGGEPGGYVQATGQGRKVIENFLRRIKAAPERTMTNKSRGKRKRLYGFETNCRVLDQWLGKWCDQNPEAKLGLIVKEALLLAEAVTDSQSPVSGKRLARLRRIFRTNAKRAAKQLDADADFEFLVSPAACIAQIKSLREKFPPPVELTFEKRFSAYVSKVVAGEPAECSF